MSKLLTKLMWAMAICALMALALGYYLGFKHVPQHVESLWHELSWDSPQKLYRAVTSKPSNEEATSAVTEAASATIALPTDLLMWEATEKSGGYIPDDTKAELVRVKKVDFSKLVATQDKPTSKEVQQTLTQRYGEELINLLKENKATLKVGKCFSAPVIDDETARVTCMVSGFNAKGENLGNISRPLTTAYDFVQFKNKANVQNPNEWYVTDHSQEIPFDYALNKR